jgi:peptidoglycan hydrolase-like protein with peptidoglycan-binding domain
MSIMSSPPASTKYSFKKGDKHQGVWAIQRGFNSCYATGLTEDGSFGTMTDAAVRQWQEDHLTTVKVVDGIFGPASQKTFVSSLEKRADQDIILPAGILASLTAAEGGNYIAAVNWSIPGGVDCGYIQRRVYRNSAGAWVESEVKQAFDSLYQLKTLAFTLRSRKDYYVTRPGVVNRANKHEYAWRLALLHHNWPYGAQRLADGYMLSSKTATWVPQGTKFTDGTPVVTFSDWAKFYAMGAPEHNHIAVTTRLITSWPA